MPLEPRSSRKYPLTDEEKQLLALARRCANQYSRACWLLADILHRFEQEPDRHRKKVLTRYFRVATGIHPDFIKSLRFMAQAYPPETRSAVLDYQAHSTVAWIAAKTGIDHHVLLQLVELGIIPLEKLNTAPRTIMKEIAEGRYNDLLRCLSDSPSNGQDRMDVDSARNSEAI